MHSPVTLQRELLGMMQDSHRISVSPVLLSKDLLKAEKKGHSQTLGHSKSLHRHMERRIAVFERKMHGDTASTDIRRRICCGHSSRGRGVVAACHSLMRLQTLLGDFLKVVKGGQKGFLQQYP